MVAKGFKNTEIGVIPEDWELESIGNLTSKIIGGGTPSRIVKEYWNGKIPWMTVKDFTSFNPNFTQESITELGLKNSATRIVPAGNLIIATRIALGKIVKYNVDVTINQDLKTINLVSKINKDYFMYSYKNLEEKIIEKGSGSTVLGLSVGDLNSFPIPLPPLPEQKAIAEALSDADIWIANLEQMIAKKRLIKQGAMQQLLSRKEDWEVKKISEIADVKSGKRLPKGTTLIDKDNGHPYIRVSDMRKGTILKSQLKFVPIEVLQQISSYIINDEDIYISVAGTLGLVGIIPKELDGCNLTENANRLTDLKCNQIFLLKVLESPLIQDKIIASQTLGAQPKLALQRIRDFEIFLPKSLIEQTRIATILSDMDSEIESLENKLAKARQIKQGMMQELLTGQVRLV